MNILYFYNNKIPNPMASSIQVINTSHALAKLGHKVIFVCRHDQINDTRSLFAFYCLKPNINFKIIRLHTPFGNGLFAQFCSSITAFLLGIYLVLFKRPRILYFIGYSTFMLLFSILRPLRIKIVTELHQPYADRKYIKKKILPALTTRKTIDLILTCSNTLKQFYISCGIDKKLIGFIQNGYNSGLFPKEHFRNRTKGMMQVKIPFDSEDKILIYGGHLYFNRGPDLLIEAMEIVAQNIKRIKLVMLGGTIKADVDRVTDLIRAKKLQDTVYLTGYVAHNRVPDYLSIADAGVVPMLDVRKHVYSNPLKIIEYMVCYLPVIAVDLPALKEVVNEQNGFLFKTGDKNSLANAI
nr:glycosyltransferase [Candidatus Omnitrophota bacterium]